MPLEDYPPYAWIMSGDSDTAVFHKKLLFSMYIAVGTASLFSSMSFRGLVMLGINMSTLLSSVVGVIHMICTKRLNYLFAEVYFYLTVVVLLLRNFVAASTGGLAEWSFVVIVVDICLVLRLPRRIALHILALTVFAMALYCFENMARVGIYNADFFGSSQEDVREKLCGCPTLPCKERATSSLIYFIGPVLVLFLDYYFTRNFACDLYKQKDEMEQVIAAAEQTAACLSRFDLGQAEAIINNSSLPPPLYCAFSHILRNLHVYRPYLPQSCFFNEDFTDSTSECDSDLCSETRPEGDKRASSGFEQSHRSSHSSKSRVSNESRELPIVVEKRRCSFTVSNMLGSHDLAATDIKQFQTSHCDVTKILIEACTTHGGVVGVMVGDHIHTSFNAVRKCAAHAKGAVEAALRINSVTKAAGLEVVTGVSSGQAYCGPFGCTELLTVATIGRASVVASLLETFGRVKGHKVVCSSSVYSDVSYAFVMRIIFGRVLYKGCVVFGYEVEAIDWDVNEEEWMYQIKGNEWDTYNESGRQYLNGEGDIATLSMSHGSSLVVQQHQDQVVEMLRSGEAVSVDVRVD